MWYVLKPTYRDESKEAILCMHHKNGARVDFYETEESALKDLIPDLLDQLDEILDSCNYDDDDDDDDVHDIIEVWKNKKEFTVIEMREILSYVKDSSNPECFDVTVAEVSVSVGDK